MFLRDRFGLLECHIKFICDDSDDKTRAGHNLPDSTSTEILHYLLNNSATLQEISNGRLEFRTGAGAMHGYANAMVVSILNRLF
jgi:hypothetical protein